MMCLVRLKNINILLLAVLLLWSCMCAVCGATEKTYTITESQLTTLETNLTELKNQNKIIEGTASDIKGTSTKLESSIGTATDASERFDQLINECQSIIDKIRKQPAEK